MQDKQTSGNSRRRNMLALGSIAAAGLLFLSVNLFAGNALNSTRLDLTEDSLYTLSDGTVSVLEQISEPLTLRFYYSEQLGRTIPSWGIYARRVQELLEEYESLAGGKIRLEIINPEPFSAEEDQAVAAGLQGVPVDQTGTPVYFGLTASNMVDDQAAIAFFQPEREARLEYDLTRLIHDLSTPDKPVLGLLSTLPIAGGPAPAMMRGMGQGGMTPPWVVYEQLDKMFDIRLLSTDLDRVPEEVKLLMLVHPADLTPQTRYAIDQFVMRGGHALVFLDPHAESQASPQPGMPSLATQSDLPELLKAWGLNYDPDQVAGDRMAAQRVSAPSGGYGSRMQAVDYLVWMGLTGSNLNRNDFITGELDSVNVATPGFLEKRPDALDADGQPLQIRALIYTSLQSDSFDVESVQTMPDPAGLLAQYKPRGEPLMIGARINGSLKTAFPDGPPEAVETGESEEGQEDDKPAGPGEHLARSAGPVNLVVIADTDLLDNSQWVQQQSFFGQSVVVPFAQNGDLVVNAVENLMGSDALISLRSRGSSSRPFEVVQNMEREADARFRTEEKRLTEKLESLDAQLAELRLGEGQASAGLLTPEQQELVDKFSREILSTRKQLRDVQLALRQDVDALESRLWFLNIAAMPLLIALLALARLLFRKARHRKIVRAARA